MDFGDVARVALPVAVVLLVGMAAARTVLWAEVDDADARQLARRCLGPLGVACLGAVALHVAALGAAGDATVRTLVVPLVLGVVAVLLHGAGEEDEVADPPPSQAAQGRAPAAAAPAGSLWADRAAHEPTRRTGLWSR